MIKITERIDSLEQQSSEDFIELDFDQRKRGRLRTISAGGMEVGLFLDRGKCLQQGDWLKADTGGLFQVIAAPEQVVEASTTDSLQFAKVCYHLGNRHVPLQIGDQWLRFQPDHVLEDLCKNYGLKVTAKQAPFQPENGAYGKHANTVHNHHQN